MATIRFTQCNHNFVQDPHSKAAGEMPVLKRVLYYEQLLSTFPDGVFSTLDENFLLVAQSMKRQGKLAELVFVSNCEDERAERTIMTDKEGDFLEEPHHGFFVQRLKYLR